MVEVQQRDLADAPFQHADARLEVPLPLFRGLVLGVLAQVAMLPRPLDLLGQLRLELALQLLDFVFEASDQPGLHRPPVNRRGRATPGKHAPNAARIHGF